MEKLTTLQWTVICYLRAILDAVLYMICVNLAWDKLGIYMLISGASSTAVMFISMINMIDYGIDTPTRAKTIKVHCWWGIGINVMVLIIAHSPWYLVAHFSITVLGCILVLGEKMYQKTITPMWERMCRSMMGL